MDTSSRPAPRPSVPLPLVLLLVLVAGGGGAGVTWWVARPAAPAPPAVSVGSETPPAYLEDLRRQLERVAEERMPLPVLDSGACVLEIPAARLAELETQLAAILAELHGSLREVSRSEMEARWLVTVRPEDQADLRGRLQTLALGLGGSAPEVAEVSAPASDLEVTVRLKAGQ